MIMNTNDSKSAGLNAGSPARPGAGTYVVPFNELTISPYNPNFGLTFEAPIIAAVSKDIELHGVPCKVELVKVSKGDGYQVLSDPKIVAALETIRGEEAGLRQDEITILEFSDTDLRCFEHIVAQHQLYDSDVSPRQWADCVARMIDELNADEARIAELLHTDRPAVNRLKKLHVYFSVLPASWQAELSRSPSVFNEKPRVTLSHWMIVAAQLQDGEITDELVALLDDSFKKELSTRALREAVKAIVNPLTKDGTKKASAKPVKYNPINVGNQALIKIDDAGSALLKVADTFPDIRDRLCEIYAELQARLEAMAIAEAKGRIGKKAGKSQNSKPLEVKG